ncbi:MAG: hypothetical protein ACHQVS_00620 [Candidatus Babeliales bacterium]
MRVLVMKKKKEPEIDHCDICNKVVTWKNSRNHYFTQSIYGCDECGDRFMKYMQEQADKFEAY